MSTGGVNTPAQLRTERELLQAVLAVGVAPDNTWAAEARALLAVERLPECNRKRNSFGARVIVFQYGKRITNEPNFYLYGSVLDGIQAWRYPPLPPAGEKS